MPNANNQYEAMFLLPSGAAGDVDGAIKLCRGILEKHGGQVLLAKKWDERRLAYEVHSQKRGLYVVTYFTAPGAAIAQIERDVNLGESVLRVMVTKADHLNADEMNAVEPQAIVPREEREPWNRPSERPDRGPREDRGDRGGDRAPRGRREETAEAGAAKD